jgi:hypothetical protein
VLRRPAFPPHEWSGRDSNPLATYAASTKITGPLRPTSIARVTEGGVCRRASLMPGSRPGDNRDPSPAHLPSLFRRPADRNARAWLDVGIALYPLSYTGRSRWQESNLRPLSYQEITEASPAQRRPSILDGRPRTRTRRLRLIRTALSPTELVALARGHGVGVDRLALYQTELQPPKRLTGFEPATSLAR